jgi:hypothetical protein
MDWVFSREIMRKNSSYFAVLTIFLPLIVFGMFGTGVAVASPSPHPNIRIRLSTSQNWSGYASESSLASPSNGFIQSVTGSWKVPTLTCSPSQNTYVAIWVGIDGYSDGTVEQTGTEQECVNGAQQNYAWTEMYPHPMQQISGITVHTGDAFTASVTYGSGSFILAISDTTTGQSFTGSARLKNAQRQSAEWIVEAPYSGGVLPLANFGTVAFSNAQFTDSSGATHVIDGLGPGTYDAITMQDPNGGTSTPSGLTDNGSTSSFSTTYSSSSTTTTNTSSGSGTLSVAITFDKACYTQNSWAYITVTVTSNGSPVNGASVTVTVANPNGGTSSGSATTNSNGQVTFRYRISPNAPLGSYSVNAQASHLDQTGSGSANFPVQAVCSP